ncbi:hypothetical protein TSAR_013971 [Trichomalopsis sarcophagae]|uniref:Uncharacterized protein n=1 Tax=Trichomalopsis sarcophagae TaxID=543379 RepID=A0A232ER07_9HYME|nr:hypothetical protein TSAR_013971 [Trichomalopsis sarcophagae]
MVGHVSPPGGDRSKFGPLEESPSDIVKVRSHWFAYPKPLYQPLGSHGFRTERRRAAVWRNFAQLYTNKILLL